MSSKHKKTEFFSPSIRGTSYDVELQSEHSQFTTKKGFSKDTIPVVNELSAATNKYNQYVHSGKLPKVRKELELKMDKLIEKLKELGNSVELITTGKLRAYEIKALKVDSVEENKEESTASNSAGMP